MARDHRSTLQRRNELAYAQGYRGAGGGVAGAYKAARNAREAGTPLPSDTTARPDLQQIVRLGGSRRLVSDLPTQGSRGERVILSQLDKADRVKITATVGGRQVDLLSKGGMSAAKFADLVEQFGSVAAAVAYVVGQVYGDELDGPDGDLDLDSFQFDMT